MPTPEEIAAKKAADDAAKKAADDAAAKAAAEADKGGESEKIANLMKDPEAIKQLIHERSRFMGESQKYLLDLNKFEKAKKDAEDKALVDQGKFKEAFESAKTERDKDRDSFKAQRIGFELNLEAIKAGMTYPEDAILLCDKSKIEVSVDYVKVTGAKEAVELLKKSKPDLFKEAGSTGTPPPGTPKPHLKGILQPAAGESVLDRITRGLEGKKK